MGKKYDVVDRFGNKIGEAHERPEIPGGIIIVFGIIIGIVMLATLVLRLVFSLPLPLIYGIPIAYIIFWAYRSKQGKPTPYVRIVIPIISVFFGLIFLGLLFYATDGTNLIAIPVLLFLAFILWKAFQD